MKVLKNNQGQIKSSKIVSIQKLGNIQKEINLINGKYIEGQTTSKQQSQSYAKSQTLMKTLSSVGEKKSATIEIVGELNHKFRNSTQTKLDQVLAKLDLITDKIGHPEVFRTHKFILDGLDLDKTTDQIREHLYWINDTKGESFEKRIKELNEIMKTITKKLEQILHEDFNKMKVETISKVTEPPNLLLLTFLGPEEHRNLQTHPQIH